MAAPIPFSILFLWRRKMLVAVDKQGNRIYANSSEKRFTDCYCPVCGEPVVHRLGKIRRAHFAHRQDTNCYFGRDKDNKSEWHIRMQNYFPKEAQEFIFVDEKTGEKHIADVFLKESNTILEFQHSPIEEREFWGRTLFHLKNKRRIVWLFDESVQNQKSQNFGRFKVEDSMIFGWPYKSFKWQRNPRQFLSKRPDIFRLSQLYSICIYSGIEGDVFHRIVDADYQFNYVAFSLHSIQMSDNIDVEDFFKSESYWQNQDPWKKIFEQKIVNERYKAWVRSRRNPLIVPQSKRFRF